MANRSIRKSSWSYYQKNRTQSRHSNQNIYTYKQDTHIYVYITRYYTTYIQDIQKQPVVMDAVRKHLLLVKKFVLLIFYAKLREENEFPVYLDINIYFKYWKRKTNLAGRNLKLENKNLKWSR